MKKTLKNILLGFALVAVLGALALVLRARMAARPRATGGDHAKARPHRRKRPHAGAHAYSRPGVFYHLRRG